MRPGLVALVGAGPGSLDFLTLKAARYLRDADVVFYDALIDPEVLALAVDADHVFVGKRAGHVQTSQAAINQALVDAARAGRRVVRLKGGDPFVFGRGSEEALALQDAGVGYDVVPGVSSAIAAPALAGIPLTHRGVSSGVVVLTGADAATCDATLEGLPPGLVTVVLMMSLAQRHAWASRLLALGWPTDTAAAVMLGAATPSSWTWRGSLEQLATMAIPADRAHLPGTLVIGRVAALPLAPETSGTAWAPAAAADPTSAFITAQPS